MWKEMTKPQKKATLIVFAIWVVAWIVFIIIGVNLEKKDPEIEPLLNTITKLFSCSMPIIFIIFTIIRRNKYMVLEILLCDALFVWMIWVSFFR